MKINKKEHQKFYENKFNRRKEEREEKEKRLEKLKQADLRLAKIQNGLLLLISCFLALIVVLFIVRAMYSIKKASASVKTTTLVSASVKSNPCNRCLSTYSYKKNLLQKLYCVRICRTYIDNLK